MKTRSSLGGQNSPRRGSGARSSRASSILFKKLRDLDRKIGKLDEYFCFKVHRSSSFSKRWREAYPIPPKLQAQRDKLDQKRKEVRALRKRFIPETKV